MHKNNYPFHEYLKIRTRRGAQIHGNCPWREDKNPSFSANEESGLWFDHGRNEGGNWDHFCKRLGINNEFQNNWSKGGNKYD